MNKDKGENMPLENNETEEIKEPETQPLDAAETEAVSDDQAPAEEQAVSEEQGEPVEGKKGKKGKKEKKKKIKKLKSELILKHGSYNAAIIAIVLVGVIVLNVLATALCLRFPLQIDLTATGQNSVTAENVDYIKAIDKDASVVVCATEDGYTDGYLASYAQNYYMAEDQTGYYSQTVTLLKSYEKYNKHIDVVFSDPDAAAFSTIQQMVPDTMLHYGDILVYCKQTDPEGKETTKTRVVGYKDMYDLSDDSGYAAMGYGTYTVSGSRVETAVTSALYTVTSEDTPIVGLLTGHSASGVFDACKENLSLNNFEVTEISDAIIKSIPEDVDILAIAAPSSDFAASEIAVIDSFLENGGLRGKGLVYYANPTAANFPVLFDFLKEWGVSFQANDIVFETDENNYIDTPRIMGLVNKNDDFTADVNDSNKLYIAGDVIPMTTAYSSFEKRATNVIMTTSETTVAAPIDTPDTWTPGDEYQKKAYDFAILTTETDYDDDNNPLVSFVLAFASTDFLSSVWASYDAVGNMAMNLSLYKTIVDAKEDSIWFMSKTLDNYSFTPPSTGSAKAVRTIFTVILPILIAVTGVVVWHRRKSR